MLDGVPHRLPYLNGGDVRNGEMAGEGHPVVFLIHNINIEVLSKIA